MNIITTCFYLALIFSMAEGKCKTLKTNCSQKKFNVSVLPNEIAGEKPIDALKGCGKKQLRMEFSGSNKYLIQPTQVDHFSVKKFCYQTKNIWTVKVMYETVPVEPLGSAIVEKFYDADPTDKWFKVCPDLSEAGEIVHILLEALPAEGMEANMLLRNVFLKAKSC